MKQLSLGLALVLLTLTTFSHALSGQPAENQSQTSSAALPSPEASTWPAGVPKDYVITPFGYSHPTCVRHISEGETVLGDDRIQYADGSVEASAPVCEYPRYTSQGLPLTGIEPATNGWVEWASATTTSSYKKMVVTWPVPPNPSYYHGQTIFLFPGLEDDNSPKKCILQPVLQYGPSAAGGGVYWSVAAWKVCTNNIVDYSSLIGANNGTIGTIWSLCAPGVNHCPTWNVEAKETGTGQTTTLTATSSEGLEFNWAFGAALEVYGVNGCDYYPDTTNDPFTVQLYNNEGDLIENPGWTGQVASGISPRCAFNVITSATRETLKWNPNP